jgi:cell pole-organizing protein PopZ
MDLLGGIKQLLHEDGLTIKGTQKLLREKGVKHVAGLGQSMTAEAAPAAAQETAPTPVVKAEDQPAPVTAPKVAAPDPTPMQDALPFDTPAPEAAPAPAFSIDLPMPPKGAPGVPARLIGRAPIDLTTLQANAAQIAPLLTRLQALQARMAG